MEFLFTANGFIVVCHLCFSFSLYDPESVHILLARIVDCKTFLVAYGLLCIIFMYLKLCDLVLSRYHGEHYSSTTYENSGESDRDPKCPFSKSVESYSPYGFGISVNNIYPMEFVHDRPSTVQVLLLLLNTLA